MSSHATHTHAALNPYRDFDFAFEDDFEDDSSISEELILGERICAPQAQRKSTMLPAFLSIVLLSGVGWALMQTRAMWEPLVTTQLAAISSSFDQPSEPTSQVAPAVAPLPVAPPLDTQAREIVDAPGAEAGTAGTAAPEAGIEEGAPTVSEQAVEGDADDASAEDVAAPLPPVVADPADPYQQRAIAAGLHPDLSRGLLRRMSDIDYRNASIAIKKALAETPDGQVYSWPRSKQAAAKLALFEVHFVKGISTDCRRYVVTVTKDHWSTTARPMEKCGLRPPARRSS